MVERVLGQTETVTETKFQLYVGYLHGFETKLRQDGEFADFKDDYEMDGGVFGAQLPLLKRPDSHWFRRGDLVGELAYTRIGGDHGDRYSKRWQLELRPGWKQFIYSHDFGYRVLGFYLLPAIGPGLGEDTFNFGLGYEAEEQTRWTWQALGFGGAEFCFNENICVWGDAGYFYEASFNGSPPYSNHGVMIRAGGAFKSNRLATRTITIVYHENPPPQNDFPKPEASKPPEPPRTAAVDPLREIFAAANTSLDELAKTDLIFPPKSDEVPLEEIPNYGGSGGTVEKNLRLEFVGRYLAENPEFKVRLHGYYLARESAKARQVRIERQALAGKPIEPRDEVENRKRSVVLAIRVKKYLVEEVGINPERILIGVEKICRNEGGEVGPCDGDHEGHQIVDVQGPSVHGSMEPIYPKGKPDPSNWQNRRVHFEYFEDEGDSFLEAMLDETS